MSKVGKIENILEEKKKNYKKCRVEFVDNLKTDVEVKTVVFKPSKMKQKEELRRMTQDYLR